MLSRYSLPPFSKIYVSGKVTDFILGNKPLALVHSQTADAKEPDGVCSSTTTIPSHFVICSVSSISTGKGFDFKISAKAKLSFVSEICLHETFYHEILKV